MRVVLPLLLTAMLFQVPYDPDGDHSMETQFDGHLTQAEMQTLISMHFPEEWHEWALNVSWCESRWYTRAENPRSTAAGLWQFLRSTWNWVAGETGTGSYESGAVFDAHANAINAAWLVQNGGPSHWVCKDRHQIVNLGDSVVSDDKGLEIGGLGRSPVTVDDQVDAIPVGVVPDCVREPVLDLEGDHVLWLKLFSVLPEPARWFYGYVPSIVEGGCVDVRDDEPSWPQPRPE